MELQQAALSEDGILYISSGFPGPFNLQVIAARTAPDNQMNLCLTDGKLYIGAKFQPAQKMELPLYSVVQVHCKFISKWMPIQISAIEVLSCKHDRLIGKPPATLHDYFLEQRDTNSRSSRDHCEGSSGSSPAREADIQGVTHRKRVKLSHDDASGSDSQSLRQASHDSQTQKIVNNVTAPPAQMENTQTHKIPFKPDSQVLAIIKQKQQADEVRPPEAAQPVLHSKLYVAQSQEVVILKSRSLNTQMSNTFISDLYERMPRWRILCRVISLRRFVSTKGKKCVLMHLIDQKGDKIKAMHYYGTRQEKSPVDSVQLGKVYYFAGGEVQASTLEGQSCLEIILDSGCEIREEEEIYIYPFSAKQNAKFNDLLHRRDELCLLGVIKSYEVYDANSYQPKQKIRGVVCSPIELTEIQFTKTLEKGQSQPEVYGLYVFVNFCVIENENAIRLQGSGSSYLCKIEQDDISFPAPKLLEHQQLKEITETMKQSRNWKQIECINLSQVKYARRTILEAKEMSLQSECPVYSEVMVCIADIKLKKQYMACPVCRRATIQQERSFHECTKCKKIVDPHPTLILSLVLADPTGSFQLDAIGEKADIFIDMASSDFWRITPEEKNCILQLSKFSQFVVKVKTVKKSFKQLVFTLNEADKQDHSMTIQEIRRRTVETKLKLEQPWE